MGDTLEIGDEIGVHWSPYKGIIVAFTKYEGCLHNILF